MRTVQALLHGGEAGEGAPVQTRFRGGHRTPDGVGPSRAEHAAENGHADDGLGALGGLAAPAQPLADDLKLNRAD